jgi:hypothetical protein
MVVLCAMAFGVPEVYGVTAVERDINGLAVNVPTIKSIPHGVEITVSDGESRTFYIYSITGQMIKSIEVSENVTVELPQGFYIIKCRDWSEKIIVK